jgi:hypothetical protein
MPTRVLWRCCVPRSSKSGSDGLDRSRAKSRSQPKADDHGRLEVGKGQAIGAVTDLASPEVPGGLVRAMPPPPRLQFNSFAPDPLNSAIQRTSALSHGAFFSSAWMTILCPFAISPRIQSATGVSELAALCLDKRSSKLFDVCPI